jgi:predicted amidophosphoribosyltransferase
MAWLLDLLFPPRCAGCGGALGSRRGRRWRALRGLPRLADPARAAVVRALRRADGLAGRALPRVRRAAARLRSARAAVAYAGAARPFIRAWKERGLRHAARPGGRADLRAPDEAGRRRHRLYPSRRRPLPDPRPPPGRASRAPPRATVWDLEAAPLLARGRSIQRQAGFSLAERRRNVRGAFRPPVPCRRASRSSTTSTRPVRPAPPRRRLCARRSTPHRGDDLRPYRALG